MSMLSIKKAPVPAKIGLLLNSKKYKIYLPGRVKKIMEIQALINYLIALFFMICYSYQFFYIFVALVKKPHRFKSFKYHRYAVMISARNEETVIGQLISSIKNQNYPAELVDIYVAADNCTDKTAEIARKEGAFVFERFSQIKKGKGYALEFLFQKVMKRNLNKYDGYFIFDADNLLDSNFISEMNKAFSSGSRILTCYRNSKNYGTNWISAGYSLWFLREAKYLNNPRMTLGTSCAVSGTGFLIHSDIIEKNKGWKHFLLTEDIEFTVDNILESEKICYCHDAILYDEQPVTFKQSWTQRLRWAKGYLQVFRKYGSSLLKGFFGKNGFSCLDMTMTIMPAIVLSLLSFILNTAAAIIGLLFKTGEISIFIGSILETLYNAYFMLFIIGLITGITEWKKINCSVPKKILYFFTFPVFMFTYIPISITALFKKIEWQPIKHTVAISLDDLKKNEQL